MTMWGKGASLINLNTILVYTVFSFLQGQQRKTVYVRYSVALRSTIFSTCDKKQDYFTVQTTQSSLYRRYMRDACTERFLLFENGTMYLFIYVIDLLLINLTVTIIMKINNKITLICSYIVNLIQLSSSDDLSRCVIGIVYWNIASGDRL